MKRGFLLILFLPISVWASDCSTVDSCNYSSMWSGFSKFEITYAESSDGEGATFEYYVSDRETLMSFETQKGTALIYSIPGVATLWSGVDSVGIKTSQECRGIVKDTFSIVQSYAVRPLFFLGFGTKGGPKNIVSEKSIDLNSEEDTRVQINPGDHMIIGGPWSLKGKVRKDTDVIRFTIHHKFVGKKEKDSKLFLHGAWSDSESNLPIDEAESLDGGLVCMAGEYSYENGKSVFTPLVEDTTNLSYIGDVKALTKPSSGRAKGARR